MSDPSDMVPEYLPRDGEQTSGNGSKSLFAGLNAICDTAMLESRADGAALALLTASRQTRDLVYATDTIAQRLDELQYTTGEGPCFDAYLKDSPQFHPELTSVAQTSRWHVFAADATQLGVHALFAFPVPNGRRPMGVLELYRRTAGNLTETEYAAAAACVSAISRRLQLNWTELVTYSGSAEEAINAAAATDSEPRNPFSRRQVHIAGGMVAVRLGLNPGEAIDRLRAYSYTNGLPISAVAADIIARRLTLPD